MLSIAIYDDNKTYLNELSSMIRAYALQKQLIVKISTFDKTEELIVAPSRYDIYFMDSDSSADIIQLSERMKKIDTKSHFVFVGEESTLVPIAFKSRIDRYLLKPVAQEKINEAMEDVCEKIREDTVIVKLTNGEKKIRSSHINYIDIIDRCLCYHLIDGDITDGQALRSSFKEAVFPLCEHPWFLFLAPSLIVNLYEIKTIESEVIVFKNGDFINFPSKYYNYLRGNWAVANNILLQ